MPDIGRNHEKGAAGNRHGRMSIAELVRERAGEHVVRLDRGVGVPCLPIRFPVPKRLDDVERVDVNALAVQKCHAGTFAADLRHFFAIMYLYKVK